MLVDEEGHGIQAIRHKSLVDLMMARPHCIPLATSPNTFWMRTAAPYTICPDADASTPLAKLLGSWLVMTPAVQASVCFPLNLEPYILHINTRRLAQARRSSWGRTMEVASALLQT